MEPGRYDYLNARLHGMRSKLFESERLLDLLKFRDLDEVLRALYPERAEKFPTHLTAERMLAERYFHVLERIAADLPAPANELFRAIALRCCLENLKVVLQYWHMKVSRGESLPQPIQEFLLCCPRRRLLDPDFLLQAESIEKFAGRLRAGPLRDFMRAVLHLYQLDGELFPLLVALDVQYYLNIHEKVSALSAEDRSVAWRLLGTEIDISNILWSARLRFNYGMSAEETLEHLCAAGLRISKNKLVAICQASDEEAMKERIPSPYSEVIGDTALSECEPPLWRYLYRIASRQFYDSVFDIGAAVAFYILKRIEMMNLARIIEGYRYELPADEVRNALIYAV